MTQIAVPPGAAGLVQNITFVVPLTASAGTARGLRIRLTQDSNPGPTGERGKGEVEDYVVDITTPGFCYGVSQGKLYEINVATGAGTFAANMAVPGVGNALAYGRELGASGALVYSTGMSDDMRLGAWDRTTGAGNDAGSLTAVGGPATGLIRGADWYAGNYWFILDGTDDLWKVTLAGTSGNYRVTAATKVADIWNNARAHDFGDFIIKPDGTMLAIANRTGGSAEFFTANLALPAPVASQLGTPPIYQNSIALGLDNKLYAGLGLNGNNTDWYVLSQTDGTILSTVGASNLSLVSDMTLATPWSAPVSTPLLDYGDFSRFPGAGSLAINNLRLGGSVDGEAAAALNTSATADDLSGIDDEDGVTLPSSINAGSIISIPVTVLNNTGSSGYLNAWIDFDDSGTINDVLCTLPGGERLVDQITIPTSAVATAANITFTVPLTARPGTGRGVRFRLNSIGGQGPAGTTGIGEVEDYTVDTTTRGNCSTPLQGFGLLALNDGTLSINSATNFIGDVGYSRGVNSTMNQKIGDTGVFSGSAQVHGAVAAFAYAANYLPQAGIQGYPGASSAVNSRLNAANDYAQSAAALFGAMAANVTLGTLNDNDSRNVNRTGPLTVVQISSLNYDSDYLQLTGNAGQDDTFIINVDGPFNFSQSEIRLVNVRPNRVLFNFRTDAVVLINKSASKFYGTILNPLGTVEYHNPAVFNGSIIARNITVHSSFNLTAAPLDLPCGSDYGDWNGSGALTTATSSTMNNNLRLGATVDAEAGVSPDAGATADGADEDGVSLLPTILQGIPVTIPVTVFNNTGFNAYLNAWLDFDNNGSFSDVIYTTSGGEKLTNQMTVASGASPVTLSLTFVVPQNATAGTARGVRFRLTDVSNPGPTGVAGDGEVEDYIVTISTQASAMDPFCGSPLFSMGAFVTGSGASFSMSQPNSGVIGQAGLASGVSSNFSAGGITGPFLVHPPASGSLGSADDLPGNGGAPLRTTLQNLSALRSEALGLSNAASALTPTQTLGTLTGSFTLNATAPDGHNVVRIDEIRLSGGAVLTINGGPLDSFVINVVNKMVFSGSSTMSITGGISASRILVNMLPGSTDLGLSGASANYGGLFVAVQTTNKVTATGNSIVTGGVFAHQLTLTGGSQIIASPFQSCPLTDYSDHSGLPLTFSRIHPRLRLGAGIDAENAAQPNATATGDDTTGMDDEDGATVPAIMTTGDAVAIQVTLLNNTGANAFLNAWVDFDGSGTLNDNLTTAGGERLMAQIAIPTAAAATTRTISFTVPATATPGPGRAVRFRFTSISNPGPSSQLTGYGEVEDYATTIDPLKLTSAMEVRAAGTGVWSSAVAMEAGSLAEFRLTLTNAGTVALRDPVAIDLLPAPGDTGAANLTVRNSAWRALLTGPVSSPAGIRSYYSLVANPKRPEVLTPDPAGSIAPAWFALPANPGEVRSLKFDGTGLTVAPATSLTITWVMAIPWDAPALSSASNSVGVSAIRTDSGARIPSFETSRATIQALAPGGEFYGDKIWADTNGDGLQTAGETGIDGVLVEFYRDNGDGTADPGTDPFVSATYTATVSGQAGTYRFGQFQPGSYFALVRPPDGWDFAPGDRGSDDGLDSDALEIVRAGRRTGIMPVTRIDPGERDLTWDAGLVSISGKAAVWAIAASSSGSMVLGGNFTKSHGTPRRNIARVTAAGTLDTTFNPGSGFDGTVRAVALRSDGMIWVGGGFSSFNGYPAAGVALLTAAGGWDASAAQPDTCMVNWVGTSGNTMYLAGSFTRVGGIPCGNIARLTASGSVDTGFNRGAGTNGPVYDATILPDGCILLAGNFTALHGVARKGIAKLKSDGSVDGAFDPGAGPTGEIYSIKPIGDGRMALTGNFRAFAGVPCNGAVRLMADGTVDTTMRPSSLNVESINSSH